MPFRFSLQSVLHLRQSLEHQQELRLRTANQQVARVQHLVEQMEARRRKMQEGRARALDGGLASAELRFALQCEEGLVRHRRELDGQLSRLQQMREQQRVAFQQARQTREMLEALRDRQLRLYEQEAARREQRDLDDLFLMRILMRREFRLRK